MRILLVEDDNLLGGGVSAALRQENYAVDWVRDGNDAAHALSASTYDLVVLDLGLPHRDGLSVLRESRACNISTPVLVLTARDTVTDRVAGLDAGADDYLVKPFDLDELFARLRALLRRGGGRAAPVIVHGEIMVEPAAHRVLRNGAEVDVTPREFVILLTLLENTGRVMTRTQLDESLYGWDEGVESNALEVHVHHLRRKLGRDLIRTIRGVGYIMEPIPTRREP